MSIRKSILFLVLGLLLTTPALAASSTAAPAAPAPAAPAPAASTAPADPVAIVNGEAISRAEFLASLEQTAGAQILDRLITMRLLLQADQKQHLVASEEIDKEYNGVRSQFPTEAEFQAALKNNGLTEASFRQQVVAKLVLDKLSVKGVTVTDDEIASYFKEHQSELGQPEEVRASHILVATEDEAKKIVEQLKGGADFAKLATELSKDPGSQSRGGDLGFFRRGDLVPEFEQVAFTLKPGEISAPVKTEFGWHVIKVVEHKAAVPATLEASRETIRATLLKQKTRQSSDVVNELRTQSNIKILWQ